MKKLLMLILSLIAFSLLSCEKGPLAEDDILYQDIDPDDTMVYILQDYEPVPGEKQGYFSYYIDLDLDHSNDFLLQGHFWPGRFDNHEMVWYHSYNVKISACHEGAYIGTKKGDDFCGGLCLEQGETISKKLEWNEEAPILGTIADHPEFNCNWTGDYFAVKLKKGKYMIYGWIDIDGDKVPVIKEMAVNLTYNKKISAGQKE